MAFKDVTYMISEWYYDTIAPHFNQLRMYRYAREIATGCFLGGTIVFGGWWFYRYYTNRNATDAQISFAAVMRLGREALANKGENITHVVEQSAVNADKYKNTAVGIGFLVLQATARAQQKDKKTACQLLDQAIAIAGNDYPLINVYKAQRALIKMDMPEVTIREEGVAELQALAKDTNNKQRDFAQYHLGLYFWSYNDINTAVTIWKELVTTDLITEPIAPSPWRAMARRQLEQAGFEVGNGQPLTPVSL